MSDVTVLLRKIADNDRAAIDSLFELLYADLHRMARARLAENGPLTLLDTTSLAHEAYLRLVNAGRVDLDSRGRFMAYVSQVLRAIIVDFARKRNAERRGGGHQHLTLNTQVAESVGGTDEDIERINDALIELEKPASLRCFAFTTHGARLLGDTIDVARFVADTIAAAATKAR